MDGGEEIKELLKENVEISKESLKILKGIRRNSRISAFFRIVYWLIIIGVAFGAYYYLQPYIKQLLDLLKQVQGYMPR